MRNLLILLLLSASAWAQGPKVAVCPDGSVVIDERTSPFQPAPCAKPAEPVAYPDDFLRVYGPPPVVLGDSLAARVAKVQYESHLAGFRGLEEPPAQYSEAIAAYHASYGLGEPVWFRTKYGSYVRWPNAPFVPAQAVRSTAYLAPGLPVASWQVKAIQGGFCLPQLNSTLPGFIVAANAKNCEPPEGEQVPAKAGFAFEELLTVDDQNTAVGEPRPIVSDRTGYEQ